MQKNSTKYLITFKIIPGQWFLGENYKIFKNHKFFLKNTKSRKE